MLVQSRMPSVATPETTEYCLNIACVLVCAYIVVRIYYISTLSRFWWTVALVVCIAVCGTSIYMLLGDKQPFTPPVRKFVCWMYYANCLWMLLAYDRTKVKPHNKVQDASNAPDTGIVNHGSIHSINHNHNNNCGNTTTFNIGTLVAVPQHQNPRPDSPVKLSEYKKGIEGIVNSALRLEEH